MLYQLGLLTIKHSPFNVDRVTRVQAAEWADKPVAGREPPLEYVGPGATEFLLSGELFPHALGGLTEWAILGAMLDSGRPQFLMRGDGLPLGWVAVTEAREEATRLGPDGVGRRLRVSITCRRAQAPAAGRLYEVLSGMFA